jgi:hypothetical protein
MSEGKYIAEIQRRVMEKDDLSHDGLLKIANEVATEHPVQYEGFRIRSAVIKAWRRFWGKR